MDTTKLLTVSQNLDEPGSVSKVDFTLAKDNPGQMELLI